MSKLIAQDKTKALILMRELIANSLEAKHLQLQAYNKIRESAMYNMLGDIGTRQFITTTTRVMQELITSNYYTLEIDKIIDVVATQVHFDESATYKIKLPNVRQKFSSGLVDQKLKYANVPRVDPVTKNKYIRFLTWFWGADWSYLEIGRYASGMSKFRGLKDLIREKISEVMETWQLGFQDFVFKGDEDKPDFTSLITHASKNIMVRDTDDPSGFKKVILKDAVTSDGKIKDEAKINFTTATADELINMVIKLKLAIERKLSYADYPDTLLIPQEEYTRCQVPINPIFNSQTRIEFLENLFSSRFGKKFSIIPVPYLDAQFNDANQNFIILYKKNPKVLRVEIAHPLKAFKLESMNGGANLEQIWMARFSEVVLMQPHLFYSFLIDRSGDSKIKTAVDVNIVNAKEIGKEDKKDPKGGKESAESTINKKNDNSVNTTTGNNK